MPRTADINYYSERDINDLLDDYLGAVNDILLGFRANDDPQLTELRVLALHNAIHAYRYGRHRLPRA